jgi:predicted outer membrane repeat protein
MRFVMLILGLIITQFPSAADARTWHILPDGTGDAPTIQAGIDSAAAGDIILIGCGSYTEHDITITTGGLVVRSESGHPGCVTIDAEQLGRVIYCQGLDASSQIEGLTLTGGVSDRGGGIECSSASPTITNCRFIGNESTFVGGGVDCRVSSSPTFSFCHFIENTATDSGGGLYCENASSPIMNDCVFIDNSSGHTGGGLRCESNSAPVLTTCTFSGNVSDFGGGLICYSSATPSLTNCTFSANTANSDGGGVYCGGFSTLTMGNSIVVFSSAGVGVLCEENSTVALSCCDLHGNDGGDWVGEIADQNGNNGNFTADPQFCSTQPGEDRLWLLQSDSPCAPGHHPQGTDCGVVGAWNVGCETTSTERLTWGDLKTRFRD